MATSKISNSEAANSPIGLPSLELLDLSEAPVFDPFTISLVSVIDAHIRFVLADSDMLDFLEDRLTTLPLVEAACRLATTGPRYGYELSECERGRLSTVLGEKFVYVGVIPNVLSASWHDDQRGARFGRRPGLLLGLKPDVATDSLKEQLCQENGDAILIFRIRGIAKTPTRYLRFFSSGIVELYTKLSCSAKPRYVEAVRLNEVDREGILRAARQSSSLEYTILGPLENLFSRGCLSGSIADEYSLCPICEEPDREYYEANADTYDPCTDYLRDENGAIHQVINMDIDFDTFEEYEDYCSSTEFY